MGNTTPEAQQDRVISNLLAKDRKFLKIPTMLVLGAGEAGKSTIVKQLRIIHNHVFSPEELSHWREVILSNIVESMKLLVEQTQLRRWELSPELQPIATLFMATVMEQADQPRTSFWDKTFSSYILQLWKDEAIQKACKVGHEFHLSESTTYMMEELQRFQDINFVPTKQDIIRSRLRTTGVNEYLLEAEDGCNLNVIDVGGQRGERKKWIHQFETAAIILFIASLSEYNQTVPEDDSVNRMKEALDVWHQVCNDKYFKNVSMILFLNKVDLFREKLINVSLNTCFEDYNGQTFDAALKHVEKKYLERNENTQKPVYVHAICATDTDLVKKLFLNVKQSILQRGIADMGF